MQGIVRSLFPSRAMVILLFLFLLSASFSATFDAERLERLPDGRNVIGLSINNQGDILASSPAPLWTDDTAVLWNGTNIAKWFSVGYILNDVGMVAGQKLVGSIAIEVPLYAAIVVSNNVTFTIEPLGARSMGPLDIDNYGHVVGLGDMLTNRQAFIWQDGKTVNLNTLVDDGPDLDVARSIADDGTIYASTYVNGGGAVVYRLTPTKNGRYKFERLFQTDRDPYVNRFGQAVVGRSLWNYSGIHDLGDLGVPERVYAYSVNSSDQVVGMAGTGSDESYHAFFYDGKTHDLNDLLSITNARFIAAHSINEYGQIAAIAWNGTNQEIFRITPKPELKVISKSESNFRWTLRPGAKRTVHLEFTEDLLIWRELLRQDSPEPVIGLELQISMRSQFLRIWRE